MYHKLTIKLNNTCKGYSQIQFELADMVQHSTIFSFRDFRKKNMPCKRPVEILTPLRINYKNGINSFTFFDFLTL